MLVTRQPNAPVEPKTFTQKLKGLDLGPIAYKLMHPEEGSGWTKGRTKRAIGHYLMFLCLIHLYPNTPLVPTEEIDAVWHHHILDTCKYAEDCQMLFGRFIHHFPYFGLRSKSDRLNLDSAFAQTQALLEKHFGTEVKIACPHNPRACVLYKGRHRNRLSDHPNPSACVLPGGSSQNRPSIRVEIGEIA